MKVLQCISAVFFLFFSGSLFSDPCVETGKSLPVVALNGEAQVGEVVYRGTEVQYLDWTSDQFKGKVFIVYHLAARMGIDEVNGDFFERLDGLEISPENYQMVTMLNIDDVFFGGSGFARKTFQENKKAHREVTFIIDDDSVIRTAWCLNDKSSTIAIVASEGKVVHFKDGKLNEDELQLFYESVQTLTGAKEIALSETRTAIAP